MNALQQLLGLFSPQQQPPAARVVQRMAPPMAMAAVPMRQQMPTGRPATNNVPNPSPNLSLLQLLVGGLRPNQAHLGTSDTLAPMYLPQGGNFNPGFSPMQNNSFGPGPNPQIRAFNSPQDNNFSPQQPWVTQ